MTTSTIRMRHPFWVFIALTSFFLAVFIAWSLAVFHVPAIDELDWHVAMTLSEREPEPVLRMFMIVATSCGGIRANFLLAIGGATYLWFHHRRRFAIAWCVIALVGGMMILELKDQLGRARPPREIRDTFVAQDNESYPSGHAMGSLVGYGMLGFVVLQRVKRVPLRIAMGAVLAAWVIVIGVSRVYLRAHWVSDILGGWLLGFAYVNACLAIYFWRRQ